MKKIVTTFLLALFLAVTVTSVNAQAAPAIDPAANLTNDVFDLVNPLKNDAIRDPKVTVTEDLTTPGGIISRALVFAFPLAGIVLFVMLVWGGFEMLSGAASKKSLDAGKQRITAAIIGFILLFTSYWIIKIVEVIFDLKIVT